MLAFANTHDGVESVAGAAQTSKAKAERDGKVRQRILSLLFLGLPVVGMLLVLWVR
jgi:hypothetical protein